MHIQQDGARVDIYNNDVEFLEELYAKEINVEVITRPANSPDKNLLDMHFFQVIQSANDEVQKERVGNLVIMTSNRILSKAQILLSCSHMICCQHYMSHINLHILYIHFIKFNLNLKEFQESNNYFKSYQMNKIEYFDELYFSLNLHLNLNIKLDFQKNSQFSTSLC